jgi:hypothetical protein
VRAGYIYCYLGNDAVPDLTAFERLFASIDLCLERPGTSRVFALSPTGEQFVTTRREIASRLAGKSHVNLQWWFGAFDDVYCGFHTDTVNEQWRVTFRFDGVEPDRVSATVSQVLMYFKENCAQGAAAALVVDRDGAFDVDWDAVVVGQQTLRELPDVLILPRAVRTPCHEAERSDLLECPHHVILNSRIFSSAPK